ncbi:MAG: arylformamidase [Deltaproteobacteria bacterium]|nr:MAG: arylformamidase [Deltaproteobacteria bacterium]
MGQTNAYRGEVLAYAPVHGAGCTVTWLRRAERAAPGLEFDEDDVEEYRGDRNVLERQGAAPSDQASKATAPSSAQPADRPLQQGDRIFDISPTLSERIAVWPGDVAYARAQTASLAEGDTIDLSSLTTTLHVGAHADAPSHYTLGGQDIASRDLDRYLGPCQVIHVHVGPGERILPEHVGTPIIAPRVLFRTGTFPDPESWTEGFASLSPDLVGWLHERGVHLVGIDTPSIDPMQSKALESHHAVASRDMAVLEGVVLDAVPQGRYTLIALPLKIEGGDASPVRAALVG